MTSLEEDGIYLGFDLSTQQLKGIAIDENLTVIYEAFVQYDTELPEFRTHGGVHVADDGLTVTAPVMMWIKALDLVMEKLRASGLDYGRVRAVSGGGQQHGSVYWRRGAFAILANLKSSRFLHDQLTTCFALTDSPTWMDSSTTSFCRQLEDNVGGANKMAEISGSKCYERFTGSQIMKLYLKRPELYRNTERISLVSSFLCSLFYGACAPIDYSDSSGMNLLDITTKQWATDCLKSCAPNLEEKLGEPVPSNHVVGTVSSYFVDRYNFKADCKVIAFMGDNPASLVGMGLSTDGIAISLGTSDTVFAWLVEPKRQMLDGHILCNPAVAEHFMGLLCFKNGSLTREQFRDEYCDGSWSLFNQLLDSTPRGNFGNIGIYFSAQEILPHAIGHYRINKDGIKVARFSAEVEIRALIEGQCLAKRLHAENIGFVIDEETKILATGGASCNSAILQVLADVFNAPVYVQTATSNAGSLGGAVNALIGSAGGGSEAYFKLAAKISESNKLVATPNKDARNIYGPMLARYRQFEHDVTTM